MSDELGVLEDGTPTVAVVDGDPDRAETYADWLSGEFEVETVPADDGVDAEPRAAVVDWQTAGPGVFEEARDRNPRPGVVAVLDGDPGTDPVELGAAAAVERPVDPADLRDSVELATLQHRYRRLVETYVETAPDGAEPTRTQLDRTLTDLVDRTEFQTLFRTALKV